MPGRASLTSPAGTGEIVMPSDPNFMCTGLVTVALFFGSTKNTRSFFAFAILCALANAPHMATITRTGTTSCFLNVISDLLFALTFYCLRLRRQATPDLRPPGDGPRTGDGVR